MAIKKTKKSAKMTKKVIRIKKPAVSTKKLGPISKSFTKGEILSTLADLTDLTRKDISSVIDALHQVIEHHVKKTGPGVFVMPGLLKIQIITKPATKARKGINPFTGQEMMFKAKPARKVVKVRALKRLKKMV